MLKIENKNLSFNAVSVVNDEVVAKFNSNYYGAGVDFNYSVENAAAHLVHQDQADADFDEFKSHVMSTIDAMDKI